MNWLFLHQYFFELLYVRVDTEKSNVRPKETSVRALYMLDFYLKLPFMKDFISKANGEQLSQSKTRQ